MKRTAKLGTLLTVFVLFILLFGSASGGTNPKAKDKGNGDGFGVEELMRIQRGFEISPVHLNFSHRDRNLVGLGSYIVNAQAACNDCHTCPSYAPGHNPFEGGDARLIRQTILLAEYRSAQSSSPPT